MAGSILLQPAPASAENPGLPMNKGQAFREFRQANDGLKGKELNQLFRVHWAEMNPVQSVAQPVFEHDTSNITQVHSPANAGLNLPNAQNLSNLNLSNLTKQQQKLERQAFNRELRETRQNINQTVQEISSGKFIRVNGGFSLDLGSAVENITLGDKLFQNENSITISIGGESKTLSAGSKVTAAEYVAAKQVLATGGQKVGLDGSGRAVGGSVDLGELTPGDKTLRVRDFVVPTNVTASGDFAKNGDVRITGDLINSGSIQAFSSDKNITTASVFADNITNNSNASITSQLNQNARDLGGIVTDLGLHLHADDSLNNYGSITSAGDLTLSAGKVMNNSGQTVAQNNLSLQAPKIFNSGRIESMTANVNLDSASTSALLVNNFGGTIAALDGAINLRTPEYQDRFDTLVSGGDLLSKEVNVYTGGGTSDVFVNELTGIVNTSGSAAHISANTEVLTIGEQCLVGDPTYYNTGFIMIGGNITVGENLAIIAGRDISTNLTSLNITARRTSGGNTGQGCNIVMIAGANVQPGSGEISPPGGPFAVLPGQNGIPSQNATSSVSFSGQSQFGGGINLGSAGANLDIHAESTGSNQNGGNITLIAYGGGITTHLASKMNASGTGSGDNGNITAIATQSIQLGNLYANGGNGTTSGTGDITVVTAAPRFSSGFSMTFDTAGNITSGNNFVGTNPLTATATAEICNAFYDGDLTMKAGGNIIMPSIHQTSSRTNINVNSLNGDVRSYGVTANRFTIIAGGKVDLLNSINAPGGMLVIAGRDINAIGSSLTATQSGNTNSITLIAGGSYTPTGLPTSVQPSGSGGSIHLESVSLIDNHSLGNNGKAGEINLIAYGGSVNTDPTGSIVSYGHGTGGGGIVFVNAQGITLGNIGQPGVDSGGITIVNGEPYPVFVSMNPTSILGYAALSGKIIDTGSSAAPVSIGNVTGVRAINLSTMGNLKIGDITTSPATTGANIIDIRMKSDQAFNLGGGGANGTGLITANAAPVGNGVSISVTNTGTGGIVVTNAPAMSVTDGDGISLKLDAGTGTLDITTLGNSISTNGVGTNRSAGTIDLRFGSLITASPSLSLSANPTGTGLGGSIVVHDNVGSEGIVLGSGAGQISISAAGSGSKVDVATTGALTVLASNPITADNVFLKSGVGGISLDSAINGASFNAVSDGAVSLLQNVSTTGDVSIAAATVSLNATTVSAANIFIDNAPGTSLTIDGGAGSTLTSTTGTGQISVVAQNGDLILAGSTTYTTAALLAVSDAGNSLVATAGSTSTALQNSCLLTSSLQGTGTFVTLGSTWNFTNGLSYANQHGDVKLSGNFTFAGANFSIISKGNIDISGATINLDGATDGGNLTMLAGFDFTPGTIDNRFDVFNTFTNFTKNSSGSIIGGSSTISTVGGTGNGGNVVAYARLGITLGNIDTSGANSSGDIKLTAQNGIDVSAGVITTNGNASRGSVSLVIGDVTIPNGFSITAGVPTSELIAASPTNGNIQVGTIYAGTATVFLTGALSYGSTISANTSITAGELNISVGAGTATIGNSTVDRLQAAGNGAVVITNHADLTLGTLSGSLSFHLNNGSNFVKGGSRKCAGRDWFRHHCKWLDCTYSNFDLHWRRHNHRQPQLVWIKWCIDAELKWQHWCRRK